MPKRAKEAPEPDFQYVTFMFLDMKGTITFILHHDFELTHTHKPK